MSTWELKPNIAFDNIKISIVFEKPVMTKFRPNIYCVSVTHNKDGGRFSIVL